MMKRGSRSVGYLKAWFAKLRRQRNPVAGIGDCREIVIKELPDKPSEEFLGFLSEYGGRVEAGLRDSQGLSAALEIGNQCVRRAMGRVRTGKACVIYHDLTFHGSLNAAATRLRDGYGLMLSVLLIVTIQGFAAAIWASRSFAPHIGGAEPLLDKTIFDGDLPPGFEAYGIFAQRIDGARPDMAQGVRREYLEAIRNAGDARWDCYVATWRAALEFIYSHELAHILYGHVDLIENRFGLATYFETDEVQDNAVSPLLSQFLEHTADMDAALQVFGDLYGKVFEQKREAVLQDQLDAGSTILGVAIAIFVLEAERTFLSRISDRGTHPPLKYRAVWVQSAEALALRKLPEQFGVIVPQDVVASMRAAMSSVLFDAAHLHEPIFSWLAYLEQDGVEDEVNDYINELRAGSSAFFDELDKHELI